MRFNFIAKMSSNKFVGKISGSLALINAFKTLSFFFSSRRLRSPLFLFAFGRRMKGLKARIHHLNEAIFQRDCDAASRINFASPRAQTDSKQSCLSVNIHVSHANSSKTKLERVDKSNRDPSERQGSQRRLWKHVLCCESNGTKRTRISSRRKSNKSV